MTRERFERIYAVACRMAAEIEWSDFPTLEPEDERARARSVVTALATSLEGVDAARAVLRAMFDLLAAAGSFEQVAGRQEDELEAAGLVQAAVKYVLAARKTGPEAARLRGLPLRTKFRRLAPPVVQGPPGVRVPSIREQMARAAARRPLPN